MPLFRILFGLFIFNKLAKLAVGCYVVDVVRWKILKKYKLNKKKLNREYLFQFLDI